MCDDDIIAAGLYLAVRERGLRIPADVSVVGFDDMDFARVLEPPLTTVALDAELLGATAFELLERAWPGAAGGRSSSPPSSSSAARRGRRPSDQSRGPSRCTSTRKERVATTGRTWRDLRAPARAHGAPGAHGGDRRHPGGERRRRDRGGLLGHDHAARRPRRQDATGLSARTGTASTTSASSSSGAGCIPPRSYPRLGDSAGAGGQSVRS